MKRSPLKRKTPLRKVSAKRRKAMRTLKVERDQYLAEHWLCQVCGKRQARDVHEIARGPARELAIGERCCWLAVCRECHRDEVGDYSRYTPARQLAVKLLADPDNFDLERFNQVRSGLPHIALADVVRYLTLKEL